jgi:hypothetical protein
MHYISGMHVHDAHDVWSISLDNAVVKHFVKHASIAERVPVGLEKGEQVYC